MCKWADQRVKAKDWKNPGEHAYTQQEIIERCKDSPGPGKMCDNTEKVEGSRLTITNVGETCDKCK